MNRFTLLVTLTSLSLAAACDKDDAAGRAATKTTEAAERLPADQPSGPWAAWDMAARRAALQGAHVVPGNALGTWHAWNVTGDKVTIWDGTAEKTLELSVASPCEVTTTERSPDGSSSGTTSHFTLQGGKLIKGLGDAGSRRGPEAVACISNKVFTLDAKGTCLEWERSMFKDGAYKSKPAECGWKQKGDVETFIASVHDRTTELEVHGDALLSGQLARTHSEKVADFAAAKAARDAKK